MSFRSDVLNRQLAFGAAHGWGFGSGGLDGADAAGQFGGGSSNTGGNGGGGYGNSLGVGYEGFGAAVSAKADPDGNGVAGDQGGAGKTVARARSALLGRRDREGYTASTAADRRGLTSRDNTSAATAAAAQDALADVALANKHGIDPGVSEYDSDFRGAMARQAGVDAQTGSLGQAASIGLGLLGGMVAGPFGAMAASSLGKSAIGATAQADARNALGLGANPDATSDFGGRFLSNMLTATLPAPASLAVDVLGNPVDAAYVAGTPAASNAPQASTGASSGLLAQVQQPSSLTQSSQAQQQPFQAINRAISFNWPT